jgi:UDP-N-acetylmuramoyl-L-alanyl-D-glutamate--2,6-diaminopimelate ligase
VKLSTLLKAIEPLSIFSLKAESPEQGTKSAAKLRFALRPMPYANLPDIDIGSIHYKAQEVETNGLFVAIEGRSADGHDFIGQALARGAAAIVVQKQPDRSIEVESGAMPTHGKPIIVHVRDTRTALADLAVCFFCRPSEYMTLIGITGTNGKTTVAYLIESILMAAGLKVGVIGTINYRYAGKTFPNPMTTPESLDLQRILKQMLQAGVTHVAMEASSHAMDLYRIRGCRFDMAVFTNLSQDHLDFHGDMQSYWSSKKRLFIEYLADGPKKNGAVAVINCDDAKGQELANILSIRVIKTGSAPDCVIKAETSQYGLMGTHGRASTPQGGFDFKTPLVGLHNVANILSSTGAAAALGIAPAIIKAGIEALAAIPGRLESIENSSGRFVYVDYAHTPDALKNAVSALKQIAPARIICVFGCGGDRDREKRPLMGEIVARLCDLSIVTSDNPRTEDPESIIDDIVAGMADTELVRVADRREAIARALELAEPADMVLLAGKGHETYQVVGRERRPFDEREVVQKLLEEGAA